MAKAREEHRPGVGWFTTDELLVFFGFDSTYFERDLKRLAQGEDEIRKINGANWFYSPTLIRKWKEKHSLRGRKKSGNHIEGEEDEVETLATSNSPAAEKWKLEQWRIARIKRREMERQLLPRELFHSVLSRFASLIRNAAGEMCRRHGNDVVYPLEQALKAGGKMIEESCAVSEQASKKGA